jgi:type I restriction enzyme, S subunit
MSEWKECKLGDVAEIQTGPFGSQLHQRDYKLVGTPIITVEHLGENKILHNDLPLVGDEDKERLKKYTLKEGDIVFSRVGSVDRRAYVRKEEDGWMFSGRCLRVRSDRSKVDPRFLSFYFGQENFKDYINRIAVGATMPSLNTTILSDVEITLPALPEQRAIASVLSSLDDKIDLLFRQNKTLEALAEALFRKRFVEGADPTWKAGKLGDEFDYTMGQSPAGESFNEDGAGIIFFQGRSDFGFRFPENRIYCTSPTRFAEKFDTLVSVRAPVGDMNMASEKCCIGRGVAAFRYKHDRSFHSYTYYKLKSMMKEIQEYNHTGTVFGSISKADFENLDIVLPDKPSINRFQNEASALDARIYLNSIEIRTLSRLRDTLLPKLMSGEVRVMS